jgi:hypothetical protein
MRPGDVICNRKHQASTHWWDAGSEELLVLDEEPTIRGCVMARGRDGKDRCVNPRYFVVVRTREEQVAERMMDGPDRGVPPFREAVREASRAMAKTGVTTMEAMKRLSDGMKLATASAADLARAARLLGCKFERRDDGREE